MKIRAWLESRTIWGIVGLVVSLIVRNTGLEEAGITSEAIVAWLTAGTGLISAAVAAWGRKNVLWPMPYGTACCGKVYH